MSGWGPSLSLHDLSLGQYNHYLTTWCSLTGALSHVHHVWLEQAGKLWLSAATSAGGNTANSGTHSRKDLTCMLVPSHAKLRVIFVPLYVLLVKLNCCVLLSS